MINTEDFKQDLKEKQAIANKNELTDFGTGYLTALERYEKLILSGVGNSTSLKEILVDFGNVVKNSKGQEVELLADAYIVYDRIKDEKE